MYKIYNNVSEETLQPLILFFFFMSFINMSYNKIIYHYFAVWNYRLLQKTMPKPGHSFFVSNMVFSSKNKGKGHRFSFSMPLKTTY